MDKESASPTRRVYSKDDFERIIADFSNWGAWGIDDERGSANYVTETTIQNAAKMIKQGKSFSLSIPFDKDGPTPSGRWRVNPQHVMIRHGGDLLANFAEKGSGFFSTDDVVYMPLQAATQWDALCHAFFDGKTYNGRGPESVDGTGAKFSSITNFKDRAVGRGVLLDLPRYFGCDFMLPGDAIQDSDLDGCARRQGVEIGEGDFVLVRTGHLAARRAAGTWGDYSGGDAPGLGLSSVTYLCPRNVTAVATDTYGVEVFPFETAEVRFPVHVALLIHAGIYLGEMWDFEALADDCARDGIYEFFLAAPPLTITGAVGSPINPLAIK